MRIKKIQLFALLLFVLVVPLISAVYTESNPQYFPFSFGQDSIGFDDSMCDKGQDFIIQIAPFGCEPAIVQSGLLEKQNSPVFCQLAATQLNPLIDVESIESISFSGEYPREVIGIGFHPARAALGVKRDLNFPVLENIGYVVINLRRTPETELTNCESSDILPGEVCWIEGNLTAKIRYDVRNAFGVGRARFYLPSMADTEWERKYSQYGFWNGKGYLRADNIESNRATISVYDSNLRKTTSVVLGTGDTSRDISIPGFDFCQGTMNIKLDSLEKPDTRAQLRINADFVEVSVGEKFLDNKCEVRSISRTGLIQNVRINCIEDDGGKTFELKIEPKVNLTISGEKIEAGVGDIIYEFGEHEEKRVFLGHIGESHDGRLFIVPVVSSARNKEQFLNSVTFRSLPFYVDTIEFASRQGTVTGLLSGLAVFGFGFQATLASWIGEGSFPIAMYYEGENDYNVLSYVSSSLPIIFDFVSRPEIFPNVSFYGFAGPKNIELDGISQDYYEDALKDYNRIIESYPNEDYESLKLGEEALYQKIQIASDLGQGESMVGFCDEFKRMYPDSENDLEVCESKYEISSPELLSRIVTIDRRDKKISFERIYEPTFEDLGVEMTISNAGNFSGTRELRNNQITSVSETETISVRDINEDYVVLDVRNIKQGTLAELTYKPESLRINLNDYRIVGENRYNIQVNKINLKKSAKVSLIPNIRNVMTEADFGFKIGVEKRAIQFTPEKTQERIEKLNDSISKWKSVSNVLGISVDVGNKACLAVGTGLNLINLIKNLEGRGIARQKVMREPGGWYEQCENMANAGEYPSVERCLLNNSKVIDEQVDDYSKILENQNKEIKVLQDQFSEPKFTEKIVNTDKFVEKYSEKIKEDLDKLGEEFVNPLNPEESIQTVAVQDLLSPEGWKDRMFTIDELKDIDFYLRVLDENPDDVRAKRVLYSLMVDVETNAGDFVERQSFADESGLGTSSLVGSLEDLKEIKIESRATFAESHYSSTEISPSDYVFSFRDRKSGRRYLLVYDADGIVEKTFEVKDGSLVLLEERNPLNFYFKKYDASSYQNEFKNPEVRYYETEPYKGFPAVVPFDLKNGWYAATKQALPILGRAGTFDASARVNTFYLCNVMGNERAEFFSGFGDDECVGISLATEHPYNQFPGLSEKEASDLVGCAVDAITQASRAYASGVRSVRINTACGGIINVNVGNPAADIPEVQCQDFMSPKECNLIFNICDPVVCPPSRCNFGGAYPVRDVVQSGIIGSIALCLPNWKEGIYVPICLTGVKAGMDNLISVQEATRDCLKENLETGRNTGICDRMSSIYMCEFIWREALPLASIAVPRITELIAGENVRGGGEYMSVQNALQGAKDSMKSFTDYYGTSVTDAFRVKSTEELGSPICRNFVSMVVPTSAGIFDKIAEPASPPQFHGRFDEIPYTTVTVPPTSHYKVFYHIYAGQNQGAHYSVYLRSGADISFYQDVSTTRRIASGYIPAGGYASETEEFTAPSGYRELCINVDGQEECGFKEVSTAFAVNFIKDSYLSYQANQTEITTEEECVSGSIFGVPSDLVSEGIYDRKVLRICATRNPGEGSDPHAGTENSRWVQVGYCGERNFGCWLDTRSIQDAIDFESVQDKTLDVVTESYLDMLINEGDYLSESEFRYSVSQIQDEEVTDEKIELINKIINRVFFNHHKAYLFYLRGGAFGILAQKEFEDAKPKEDLDDDPKETDRETEERKTEDTDGNGEPREREEAEITEDMGRLGFSPIFEYRDGYVFPNLYYRYFNDGWEWSRDEKSWYPTTIPPDTGLAENDDNVGFIENLINKKYSEGLELLVDRALEGKPGLIKQRLVTEYVRMNHKGEFWIDTEPSVFGAIYPRTTIYLKFEDDEWSVSGEESYPPISQQLLDKDFYEGAEIIFSFGPDSEDVSEEDNGEAIELSNEERYNQVKGTFEKYSEENIPMEWSVNDFKALLVAIAEKESNLEGDWLMGYGIDNEGYRGTERQIQYASNTFKRAFERRNSLYDGCNSRTGLSQVECVLSVYNTGKIPNIWNDAGKKYAKDVLEKWAVWREYFGPGEIVSSGVTREF